MLLYQEILLGLVFIGIVVLVLWAPRIPFPNRIRTVWMERIFAGDNGKFGFPLDMGTAPVLGVLILIATLSLGTSDIQFGFVGDASIQPYAIVILFISLAYVCISLDVTGLLAYIAFRAANAAGNSGRRLFVYTFLLSSIFTIVTSNDIVILTLTPVICHFTALLKLDPTPYLFAQFFAANIWSTALYIGNPTNIIVSLAFQLSFLEYSKWMTIPAIVSGVTCFILLFAVFRTRIPVVISIPEGADSNPRDKLKDVPGAIFGSIVLVLCLILLAVSFWISVPVWAVTLAAGCAMLVRDFVYDVRNGRRQRMDNSAYDKSTLMSDQDGLVYQRPTFGSVNAVISDESMREKDEEARISGGFQKPVEEFVIHCGPWKFPTLTETLSRVPWKVIPFVFCMFIITNGFYNSSWFALVATGLSSLTNQSVWIGSILMGSLSSMLCNVFNNQPMTILMTRLLQHPNFINRPCEFRAAMFSLILGSNYGANFTFLGALAGIMWSKILSDKGVKAVSFWTFFKYGVLIMPFVVVSGCIALAAEMHFMPCV